MLELFNNCYIDAFIPHRIIISLQINLHNMIQGFLSERLRLSALQWSIADRLLDGMEWKALICKKKKKRINKMKNLHVREMNGWNFN